MESTMERADFERLVRLEEASTHAREALHKHSAEAKEEMGEIRQALGQVNDRVGSLAEQVKYLADLSAQRLIQLESMSVSLDKVQKTLSNAKAGWRTLVYAGSAVTTFLTVVATAAWWLAGKLWPIVAAGPR